jgi:lysophospholipase L1-like esterase
MPSVAGKRVLLFGDSLSAGTSSPGAILASRLRQAGAEVQVSARIGRSAWNFYGREDAAAELVAAKAFRPSIVIVALGTNDIGLSAAADRERMLLLRQELASDGGDVWAFGPPSFPRSGPGSKLDAGAPAVADMMQSVFGVSRFLDLRVLTEDMRVAGQHGRSADGVHFTAAGGTIVGDRMADAFLKAPASMSGPLMFMAAAAGLAWWLFR